MSSDNHDRPRIVHRTQRGEDCSFDARKIKKERNDMCSENGAHTVDISNIVNNDLGHEHASRDRASAGSRLSNGFHADFLQEFIATKLVSNAHGSVAKNDKIRLMIEESISDESKSRVQEIYLQVEQLTIEEKLLLYLKLPASLTNLSGTVDPLRQPLNPLGNRYEIHQTIMWIKTHLEEDPDVSLPKQEVYDEYNFFCTRNSMKPLSTADFGKVMKQVYPRVRPRRLGTRGNSRYCYAGMRKRVKLDTPTLPAILGAIEDEDFDEPVSEKMLGAASTLIREWAESTLGHNFLSLSALARHLVQNLCVDTRSLAAVCILSASADSPSSSNKIVETPPKSSTPIGSKSGKLREAQLQLQKKLQQREHIRDQKHRHVDLVSHSKDKSSEQRNSVGKASKKTKSNQSPQTTRSTTNLVIKSSPATFNRSRKLPRSASQASTVSPQLNCDNTAGRALEEPPNGSCLRSYTPNDAVYQREAKAPTKTSRKRTSLDQTRSNSETSPEKQAKLSGDQDPIKSEDPKVSLPKITTIQRPSKISVVSPGNLKSTKLEVVDNPIVKAPRKCQDNVVDTQANTNGRASVFETSIISTADDSSVLKDQLRMLQENSAFLDKNDKLCTIDADALDDYLNGGNNSQEPEEELLQYFQQSSSSSSDAESVQPVINTDADQSSRSDKVSQLRLILQQNLKGTIRTEAPTKPSQPKKCEVQKDDIILPTLLNHQSQANSRRRVSFETNVVEHVQESNPVHTVPQSPNTRRRIFNFTPISPSPHSPSNGRISKPNSANASPFVSPRNTPVPRSRSNMTGVCRSRASQRRPISCNAPYSGKNETFIVPTSNHETSKISSTLALKTTEVQAGNVRIMGPDKLTCTSLLNDINPQKQLLINYPSQENLLEIKNVHRRSKPADQEISELLNSVKPLSNEHYYRSQSVPLHRMVNPTLMSPISTGTFQSYHSVNPSTSSSLVHTPVPSEFDDFGSIGQSDNYLLDEVDANFISDEQQQFLMEDKEISPENITKILDYLDESGKSNILPEQTDEIINGTGLMLDSLPNTNLSVQETMLDPSTLNPSVDTLQKIIQSRSYPNTPLPNTTSYPPTFTEDSNGSRSYPSTPIHTIQPQEVYRETNEPMLSSPTLNSLNLHGEQANADPADNVCRNVSDLLESNFLDNVEVEGDLDPLSNFDGLQDVDSLTPLFNEVSETNR